MLRATLLTGLATVGSAAYSPATAPRPALRSTRAARSALAYTRMFPEEEVMDEEEFEEYVPPPPKEMSEAGKKVLNNMKSESGVEFAPWMKVDAEAIARAKKEREERRRRAAENAGKLDTMLIDPQAAELGAGGGLNSKTLSEEEVELRWSTQDEGGNQGFIVQRRPGGQANFVDIASYEDFSPLRTKGPNGGDYVYLDDTVAPGTWVYRIVDCDSKGQMSAICQKLVEVESGAEQTQTLVVGGVIAGLALVLVAAGILSDPIQTTDMGSKMF
jgi:hypothetical protein